MHRDTGQGHFHCLFLKWNSQSRSRHESVGLCCILNKEPQTYGKDWLNFKPLTLGILKHVLILLVSGLPWRSFTWLWSHGISRDIKIESPLLVKWMFILWWNISIMLHNVWVIFHIPMKRLHHSLGLCGKVLYNVVVRPVDVECDSSSTDK